MVKKVVYFDWDGTLFDKEVSQKANIMRGELLEQGIDKEELVRLQHNNHNDHYGFIQSLIKEKLGVVDELEVKQFQAVLFGFFYNKIVSEGAERYCLVDFNKLLKLKKKYDLEFVIVTSLWSGVLGGAMNFLNKDGLFDRVYSVDVSLSGSKKDFIAKDIELYQDRVPLAMVGDRGDDIEAGSENGLKTIFCNYGHGSFEGADYEISSAGEMIERIEDIIREN